MRVLSISLDKKIIAAGSESRKRQIEYGKALGELYVVVLNCGQEHSEQAGLGTWVYSTGSRSKVFMVWDAVRLGKKMPRPDIVTAQEAFSGLAAYCLKRFFKVPFQLQIHTDFLSPYFRRESLKRWFEYRLFLFLIPRADCIRVVSERIKKSLVEKFKNYPLSSIRVVPVFVDIKAITDAEPKTDLKKKYPGYDFYVLMASRFTIEKNIGLAVEAMSRLIKNHPKVALVIVGAGPLEGDIKSKIRSLNLEDNVKVEGWTDDLVSYYKTADLYLLASNYEGYGRTLVEAAAAGCKVLASDVGVAGEILEKDAIFNVNDIDDLSRKLELAEEGKLSHPKLLQHVGGSTMIAEYVRSLSEFASTEPRRKKLLIVTQKVNKDDQALGFFHRWIEEFSKHFENVTVVCLEKGNYDLPKNVKVFSLGKERHVPKFLRLLRFYGYIWKESKKYDSVFVHMNPIYVVLGGLFWRIAGKRIVLWYVHRSVTWKLRIATFLSDVVCTAAPESFRISSKKAEVLGHGIDIEKFTCSSAVKPGDTLTLLHVGRITRIKNIDTLVEALRILNRELDKTVNLVCVGLPARDKDRDYLDYLKKLIANYRLDDRVDFKGSVPHARIQDVYCRADVSVNLTPTGGIDKVVLESLAAKVPAFSSNEAFKSYLGRYAGDFLFRFGDPEDLARKIEIFLGRPDKGEVLDFLYEQVRTRAGLSNLIEKISQFL